EAEALKRANGDAKTGAVAASGVRDADDAPTTRTDAAFRLSDRAVLGDLAQPQADRLPMAEAADPRSRFIARTQCCRLHRPRIGIDPIPTNARGPREHTSAVAANPIQSAPECRVVCAPPVEARLEVLQEETALDELRR